MRLTTGEVAERLWSEGVVTAAEVDALRRAVSHDGEDDIPWYMRVAVGAGAWAATAFLLAFLFGLQLIRGDVPRIVFGVVLVAAALWARREATAEFLRQAAVAGSLAGMGLIIVSLGSLTHSGAAAGTVGVILSAAMIILMPDRVHRFLATLVCAVCAVVAVLDLEWPRGLEVVAIALFLLAGWVWRFRLRERELRVAELLEPVGYGAIVAIFAILLFSTATDGRISPLHSGTAGLGIFTTAAIAILLLALVVGIFEEHGRSPAEPTTLLVLASIVLLAVLTRATPGIVAGVAVLVLGFDRRNPVLIAMAALFLAVFGSVYYYSLQMTLIEKAGVLAASGALLVAARMVIERGRSHAPTVGGEGAP